jgi:hypothetical protein
MIERHEGKMQITCDTCPASFPQTYAEEDFRQMISDAKAARWVFRQVKPDADRRDTSDLFGAAPRIAGNARKQAYIHTCPACARPAPKQGGLL